MKQIKYFIFLFFFLSCSSKKEIVYLGVLDENNLSKINNNTFNNFIETGDILKIDIQTVIPETAIPYTKQSKVQNLDSDLLKVEGYLVNDQSIINYPILGEISVLNLNEADLEKKITKLLIDGGHLTNPFVKVKIINKKFTILGEVKSPGTYSFYENKLNIFQALGFAGDLLITAKRKNIRLIREENGLRKYYQFSLTKSDLLAKPYYYIKNNDVIIVEPNYSKVKSAGFVGSPSSISSIASLLLSITLLIINK